MNNEKQKESFVMYGSYLEAAEILDGEAFKEFILKLRDYALKGIDSTSDNPFINSLLIMAKPTLQAANNRYNPSKANGEKGAGLG